MSLEPKKLALLRIWEILKEYSDYDHPLTQADIAGKLESEYGIVVERKAIGRNLSLLKEAGIEIEQRRDGSYLESREFDDSELHMIIDDRQPGAVLQHRADRYGHRGRPPAPLRLQQVRTRQETPQVVAAIRQSVSDDPPQPALLPDGL